MNYLAIILVLHVVVNLLMPSLDKSSNLNYLGIYSNLNDFCKEFMINPSEYNKKRLRRLER